jgi:hypothetical protein
MSRYIFPSLISLQYTNQSTGMSRFRYGLLPLQTHPPPSSQTRPENILPHHPRGRRRINHSTRLKRCKTRQRPRATTRSSYESTRTTTTCKPTRRFARAFYHGYHDHGHQRRIPRHITRHFASRIKHTLSIFSSITSFNSPSFITGSIPSF